MANTKKKKTSNKKFKFNGILLFTITLVAIPLFILGFILLSSIHQTGVPVTTGRFDTQLDPTISDSMIEEVEDALVFEDVDSINVNLSVATLRILINTSDDASASTIKSIANEAYDIVNGIIDVDTYFTNHDTTKMYDLEIHVYNLIPDSSVEDEAEQLYILIHKSASEEEYSIEWETKVTDQDTYDAIQEALDILEQASTETEDGEEESESEE